MTVRDPIDEAGSPIIIAVRPSLNAHSAVILATGIAEMQVLALYRITDTQYLICNKQ